MTIPAVNQNQNQDEQQQTSEQDSQNNSEDQNQENTSIQQTDPQQAPPTDEKKESDHARYVGLLEANLREQNRQILELQARREQATVAAPTLTPEEDRQRFYDEPRKIIQEELQKTIAPLTEFVRQFQGQSQLDQLKNRFKNDPRFSSMWDSNIESAVDEIMSKAEVNEANVQAAIVHAIGLRAIGQIPGASASTAPAPNGNPVPSTRSNVATPPHVRPSAPLSASTAEKKKLRSLTENERRLARENSMSDEEYLKWLEVPVDQVITTDIGRPKK